MADEEQNEKVEETTPVAEVAEGADSAPEAVEAVEAAPEADGASAPAPAPAAKDEPRPSAKERNRKGRAARSAAQPARTPEERQAERDVARRQKATQRRTVRAKLRVKAAEARKANPASPTPPAEHGTGRQKVRQGIVVSDKADKTITVRTDVARRHRRYEKIVRSSSTLHAHDERNDAHVGDTVIVRESRPLSRLKRWRLVEVVERAK